jgi:hypothetical protein
MFDLPRTVTSYGTHADCPNRVHPARQRAAQNAVHAERQIWASDPGISPS